MEQTLTINDQLVELGTLEKNEATSVQRVGARLIDEFLGSYPAPIHNDEIVANVLYKSSESVVGAEIIRGVRASSIKIESTSSTTTKFGSRCRKLSDSYSILSRK